MNIGQIWQGDKHLAKCIWWWKIQFTFSRCATAALAALLPTLLLRGRKVLTDSSPDKHSDPPPSEHESTTSDHRKDPCDDADTDDLTEEDICRVLGVVDGKS